MRTTAVVVAVICLTAACGGSDTSAHFDAISAACGDNPCPGATHEILTAPITGRPDAGQPATAATLECFCAAGSIQGIIPPSAPNCDALRQAWAAGQCH